MWPLNAAHFSSAARVDSSFDRHAGKRTIPKGKQAKSDDFFNSLPLAACCNLDFRLSCQIAFRIFKVDSHLAR